MSSKKDIRTFAEDWKAEIEARGMLLKQDPWTLPEIYTASVLDPPTPEGIERTANLQKERLAREDAANRASAKVEEVQEIVRTATS